MPLDPLHGSTPLFQLHSPSIDQLFPSSIPNMARSGLQQDVINMYRQYVAASVLLPEQPVSIGHIADSHFRGVRNAMSKPRVRFDSL
jgi:hypothetical protein